MVACKPGTPRQYIQPDDMEDILVDYHMARAMAQQLNIPPSERDYNQSLYVQAVLRNHGVTQAEFDSSLVYYYTRADRFDDIYERVARRLEERALVLGATEGEIGKYATFNSTGDTANIWPDRTVTCLMPIPPYNRWEFNMEADSAYRRGDALMMQFMTDYMYQTGVKSGMLYLAVVYEDTVVSRNLHFSVSGLSQLRVPEDTTRVIKGIKGYFYLGQGSDDQSTAVRLLFLNNVQLIRFHTKPAEYEATDSIARDSVGGRNQTGLVGCRDSLRNSEALVPADAGDAIHQVETGTDSLTARRTGLPTRVP